MSKRLVAPASRARRRKTLLGVESIEQRLMLTGTGFIAGFATHAGTPATVDVGATINLYNAAGTTLVGSTKTDVDGYYQFTNISPGNYQVSEAEAGYSTSAVSASTVVNNATPINGGTAFAVTVVDPTAQVDKLTLNTDPYQAGLTTFSLVNGPLNAYSLAGIQTNQLNFSISDLTAGQTSGNSTSLVGVCSDLYDPVSVGNNYTVTPSQLPGPTALTSNVGEIGYLYNHYGTAVQAPAQGAGLQLAIWALLYNPQASPSTPVSLTGPNFSVTSSTDPAIIAAANGYLTQAVGKSEDAWFLNVTSPQTMDTGQGTMGADLLNFTSTLAPPRTGAINGDVFLDGNDGGVAPGTPSTANGLGGILVTAAPAGGGTPLTTRTLPNGTYSFPSVPAGSYTVTIGQPGGYLPGYESQDGTLIPGKAISTAPVATAVTAGGTTSDNFAELVPSTVSGYVYDDATAVGVIKPGDATVATTLTLTGTNDLGQAVGLTTTSVNSASAVPYRFGTLRPGTYTVTASQPIGYNPGTDNVGTVSTAGGPATVIGAVNGGNGIGGITLSPASTGVGYNFGEVGSKITGTVYLDGTGNGLSATNAPLTGDTPEAGVTVNLLSGTKVVATTTSASDGTYAFAGVPLGAYTVSETPPAGQVQTGPIALTYPITTTAAAPNSSNDNFSNYAACNTSAITNIYYQDNWGCRLSTLAGNTRQGDTVSATFTVTGNSSQMLTLVSYANPNANTGALTQQVVYSIDSGLFTPGTHTVSVELPRGYYQVDFVCGAAITQFGPAGSTLTYHGENRFFSSDSGGCNVACYGPLPLASDQADIGSPVVPGTFTYENGRYALTATTGDVWGTSDQENYVYQALNGDGELVTRVTGLAASDPWAKAGIQVRQSLASNSAQASIFATPGNGIVFQDREVAGGISNSWQANNNEGWQSNCWGSTSVYLKLVRSGNTLAAFDSANGINWNFVGSDTISLTQQVYIGLAVTSHTSCNTATANFDNVSTAGYWAGGYGQSLIQSFGGCSSSTALSGWLAGTYPNLYGSKAGGDNLVGLTNNGVASFVLMIESQFGPESLEYQTLSTALDEYATSWQLGGSSSWCYGFNASWSGISQTYYNTNGATDAFGASSCNPWETVGSMLSAENNQACGGVLYAGNTARHSEALLYVFCANTFCC